MITRHARTLTVEIPHNEGEKKKRPNMRACQLQRQSYNCRRYVLSKLLGRESRSWLYSSRSFEAIIHGADVLQTKLFWITAANQTENIRCPLGPSLKWSTPTPTNTRTFPCMNAHILRLRGKVGESKKEALLAGHTLQITICTRHLRTEQSGWRENKQTENRT